MVADESHDENQLNTVANQAHGEEVERAPVCLDREPSSFAELALAINDCLKAEEESAKQAAILDAKRKEAWRKLGNSEVKPLLEKYQEAARALGHVAPNPVEQEAKFTWQLLFPNGSSDNVSLRLEWEHESAKPARIRINAEVVSLIGLESALVAHFCSVHSSRHLRLHDLVRQANGKARLGCAYPLDLSKLFG